jgi:hypothetical protein
VAIVGAVGVGGWSWVGGSLMRTAPVPTGVPAEPRSGSAGGLPEGKEGLPVSSEELGGASSWVLEGNPTSEVSILLNLPLFKLMLAMYVLVLFSMGEWGFPLGQRDRWLVCWLVFEVLFLSLETFGMLVQW